MFCPTCGSAVQEGRKFCGKCGAVLHGGAVGSLVPDTVAPARPLVAQPRPAITPMSPAKKAMVALTVLVVVAAGGGWWWWSHRSIPAYQVKDPGIYPFHEASPDGKIEQYGFVDANGDVVVQPTWDRVGMNSVLGREVTCSEGLCAVLKDGKWGYIDNVGKRAIANQFDGAGPFVNGLARVKLGNRIGYIDKTGRYVINPQFNNAGDFFAGLAAAQANTGWGFIGKSGRWAIPPHLDAVDINGFSDRLAGACMEGKCGYISQSGTFVVRPQFDNVSTFSDGLAAVQIAGKWGYIDRSGAVVINPQFDNVTMFSNSFAVVTVSGNTGTIDRQGKYVLNPGQYPTNGAEDLLQRVGTADGRLGLMTRDGKWVIQPTDALKGIGAIYGRAFEGYVAGQLTPISIAGKVLAGPYKGAMLDTLSKDIENEISAIQSMHMLAAQETIYSNTYPATGFAGSISKLGPGVGSPDEDHAGLIDAALATGTKDGYQFTANIPEGASSAGANFNYFIDAKPTAGQIGRIFCADSTGVIRASPPGTPCTVASPQL